MNANLATLFWKIWQPCCWSFLDAYIDFVILQNVGLAEILGL